MTNTNNMKKLLTTVTKLYTCDICGQEYKTHHEAVKCADQCLQQQMTAKKVTT